MTIKLVTVGKTDSKALEGMILKYVDRLKHYIRFKPIIVPDIKNTKNLSGQEQKIKEGEAILKLLVSADFVVLLDENGKQFSSVEFSQVLQKRMNSGIKNLYFIIGGPYGFSDDVYNRADQKISLSKMTFSHQMVRLFVVEQLYRGFTILKNEPYHHQ